LRFCGSGAIRPDDFSILCYELPLQTGESMKPQPKASLASYSKGDRPRSARADVARPAKVNGGNKRNAAATRERILQAALKEFAAKGLEGRVEDIAEMAGANRRMAYYYFGSKEGLFLAALERTYFEQVEVEKAIDVNALDPMVAIEALVAAKFEHYVKYPHYVEFLKLENVYQARHLKTSKRLAEMRAPFISMISRVLERGQSLGVLRKNVDPLDLYISICALGFFVFSNRHTLGAIFKADITSPAALKRRRQLIIDMVTCYLQAV
jgi:TetR/AcrR family transcriptional regulator